jgi:hypothetical protein
VRGGGAVGEFGGDEGGGEVHGDVDAGAEDEAVVRVWRGVGAGEEGGGGVVDGCGEGYGEVLGVLAVNTR